MSPAPPVDPLEAAARHAELALPIADLPLPKRVVERLTRFLLEPQRAYNRGVVDTLRMLRTTDVDLAQRIDLRAATTEQLASELRSDLTELHIRLGDSQTATNLTKVQIADLARATQDIDGRMERVEAMLAELRAERLDR